MAKKETEEQGKLPKAYMEALESNLQSSIDAFMSRWIPMPKFNVDVEIMSLHQLRDNLGLRANSDTPDLWPVAEKRLLENGYRWHWLGGQRVMFLKESEDYSGTLASAGGDGWTEAEEWKDDD